MLQIVVLSILIKQSDLFVILPGCDLLVEIVGSFLLYDSYEDSVLTPNLMSPKIRASRIYALHSNSSPADDEDLKSALLYKSVCTSVVVFLTSMQDLPQAQQNSRLGYSETSVFFVIISSDVPEEDVLQQITDVNEQMEYPRYHPPVVICHFDGDGQLLQANFLCYMCSNSYQLFPVSNGDIGTHHRLIHIHKNLNWIGNGHVKVYTKVHLTLEFPPEKLAAQPRLADCVKYFDSEDECDDLMALWALVKNNVNYTTIPVSDYFDDSLDPISSYFCFDCKLNSELQQVGSKIFYSDDKLLQFVYCEPKVNYENPSWLFFIEPFHPYVWFLFILSAAIIAVFEKDIGYASDLLMSFINQHCSRKWPFALSISLLAVTFLSHEYQSFMTSNVTAPPLPRHFETSKELFDNGYRFILPNEMLIEFIEVHFGSVMNKKFSKKLPGERFIIDSSINMFDDKPRPDWWPKMSDMKGVIASYTEINKYFEADSFSTRYVNVSCHIVEEIFHEAQYFWSTRSFLSASIHQTLVYLNEAHIDIQLYKRYVGKIFKSLNGKGSDDENLLEQNGNDSTINPTDESSSFSIRKKSGRISFKALSIHSTVKVMIVLFSGACTFSLLVFLSEKLLHY